LYTPGKNKLPSKISAAQSLVHHNGKAGTKAVGNLQPVIFPFCAHMQSSQIKASHAVPTIMTDSFGEAVTDVFVKPCIKIS
jgi:hypothetical protein